jgi:hypothetical protein
MRENLLLPEVSYRQKKKRKKGRKKEENCSQAKRATSSLV